jgi:hypothetical protein
MPRDSFDPAPEQQNVVLINSTKLQKAQQLIGGCEVCSEHAELPFEKCIFLRLGSVPRRSRDGRFIKFG